MQNRARTPKSRGRLDRQPRPRRSSTSEPPGGEPCQSRLGQRSSGAARCRHEWRESRDPRRNGGSCETRRGRLTGRRCRSDAGSRGWRPVPTSQARALSAVRGIRAAARGSGGHPGSDEGETAQFHPVKAQSLELACSHPSTGPGVGHTDRSCKPRFRSIFSSCLSPF